MNKHTPGPWKWVVEYRNDDYRLVQKDLNSEYINSEDFDESHNVRLVAETPDGCTGVADAWCDRSGDWYGIAVSMQDARLIAAAPELLQALNALMMRAARDAENYAPNGNEPIWAFIADASDAIAKATGEEI